MPIDPQTLAQMLQSAQSPQTVEGDSQQAPQPVPPAQQTDVEQPQPESTKLLLKPSQSSAPSSLSDMMLQGAYANSNGPGMQIPTFKDDTSPARGILANMVLGMGASLTGQKFQSIQERKYQRYLDNVKLQLEQQQRNQQLQIGMGNVYAKLQRDQNNTQFKNLQLAINQEKDTTKQQYLQQVFDANYGQNGLKWQQFKQMQDRYDALQKHMNNQDATAADKLDPQIKDNDYLRAVALTQAKYNNANIDYESDPQAKMSFLKDVENITMAIKAQEAAQRAQGQNQPKPQLVADPVTGTFRAVGNGSQIPNWSPQNPNGQFNTVTQAGGMNTTSKATQRAGEQGAIIQTAGEHLIQMLDQNRDKVGNMEAYWKQARNNTPFADSTQSYLNSLLQSYIALQPALHGYRSTEAMDHFAKNIGGIPKNVDALIAAIRATNETGGIVNAISKGQKPGGNVEKWVRDKNGNLVKQ